MKCKANSDVKSASYSNLYSIIICVLVRSRWLYEQQHHNERQRWEYVVPVISKVHLKRSSENIHVNDMYNFRDVAPISFQRSLYRNRKTGSVLSPCHIRARPNRRWRCFRGTRVHTSTTGWLSTDENDYVLVLVPKTHFIATESNFFLSLLSITFLLQSWNCKPK